MIAATTILLPLAFLSPSFGEMVLIAVIVLLLYGSDLPEVARTWGKAYQEFRRHLSGMRNELNDVMYAEPDSPRRLHYYPEFQQTVATDDEQPAAIQCDSPVARAAAEAEAAHLATESHSDAAADEPAVRHDTHGAA